MKVWLIHWSFRTGVQHLNTRVDVCSTKEKAEERADKLIQLFQKENRQTVCRFIGADSLVFEIQEKEVDTIDL